MRVYGIIHPAIQSVASGDSSDCVLRSICNLTGEPYSFVYGVAQACGRVAGKGCTGKVVALILKEFGFRPISFHGTTKNAYGHQYFAYHFVSKDYQLKPGITLGRFIKENPTGEFFVLVRGHATVIKNGKLCDTISVKSNMSVLAVYSR